MGIAHCGILFEKARELFDQPYNALYSLGFLYGANIQNTKRRPRL